MPASIPTTEPTLIFAGDTVKWTKSLPDYLPADSWVLSYALVLASDQHLETATNNGDGTHLVTITAAESAVFVAGVYTWQSYVTKAGERYRISSGQITVRTNYAAAGLSAGFDARSHAKKMLDALETAIEGGALTATQQSYSIGTGSTQRSISKLSPTELILWHSHYKALYRNELLRERGRSGVIKGRI